MFLISTPTDLSYENGREYLIAANGGALQVQKYLNNGTLVDVFNSPLADGDEKFLVTETWRADGDTGTKIRMIPTGTVFVSFMPTIRS